MLRWAFLLALLSTSALASRADRLSVSPRLDRRDRLGATVAAPNPVLLSLSLLPPDSECSGTPPDGVTFTRASAATCIDSSGVAHALTTDEARVHSTLGLLVEGSATNAVLHSRDVTAAAWVGTGCTKTATGMDGAALVGRCTGPTSAVQPLTVATGSRTASVYVRRVSGTCNVSLKADLETTSRALLGGWERLTLTYTSDGSVTLDVSVNSGCVADIDYVQDEAGGIATSPIVTSGTAAVRAAEVVTVASDASNSEGCAGVDFAPIWGVSGSSTTAYLIRGTNTSVRLIYSNGANTLLAFDGSNVSAATSLWVTGVPRRYRSEWSSSGNRLQVFNETEGIDGSPQVFSGFPAAVSPMQLGGNGTTSAVAQGYLRNLILGRTPEACQ